MLGVVGVFFGYCYLVWLCFNGGKGIVIYVGIVFVLLWLVGLVFVVFWFGVLVVFCYFLFGGISVVIVVLVVIVFWGDFEICVLFIVFVLVVLWKYCVNIEWLFVGIELCVG